VTNLPEDGVFKTGDLMRWTTPEVCQPTGKTVATVYAVLDFPTEYGTAVVKTPLVERDFFIPEGFPLCNEDNPTSVYINGNLPTGVYHFEVLACAYNPTPQPECTLSQGPKNVRIERMVGNE
jgi:hypothetical protein